MEAKMLRELCLKTLLIALFACVLVLGNIIIVFAQSETDTNLMIKLSPSIIEAGEKAHKIGYVGFVNPNGNLIKQTKDVIVKLESSNPEIATVPSQIMIPAGSEFSIFEVTTAKSGTAKILASFGEKIKFDTLTVGQSINIGNDLRLIINLPTSEMNVNSQMPFSLYLHDSNGDIAQAPFDIDIVLDYEDSLVGLETNELKISKGNSYVWSIIKSKDKVGNAFLRATSDKLGFDEAKEIRISSSLPSSLAVNIFPETVPATLKRDLDVIVTLKDSDGLPTLAQEDIKLQFFADDESITRQIDRLIKESQINGIIKKGEFSYRLKLKLDLPNEDKTHTIGATTKGLGVASDTFETVEPLTTNNPQAANKTLQIFTLNQIPTKSQALAIIQIGALIDDDETSDSEDESEGEFHPVIVNENYMSSGSEQKINLISSNDLLVKISNIGNIDVTSTYGTAIIETGQETGQVVLSTTIKGIGSASTVTEVINTLKHERTMIFSPTGSIAMLFDKNGYFDLFIISLDTKNRPTIVENENRYLLAPINSIVSIEKNKTFSHLLFQGNAIQEQDKMITISAIPIGESADVGLEAKNDFEIKPTAQLRTYVPFETLNSENVRYTGIIQVLDFYDNPIIRTSDLRVKISPSEFDKVDIPEYVTIPAGASYAAFPMETNGDTSAISFVASSKGLVSGSKEVDVKSQITNLKISIGSVIEPIPAEQPTVLTVYVDDEYQNAVDGVTLRVLSDDSSVSSQTVRTNADGSATIQFSPKQAPKMSLQILASAEGYSEEQESFEFAVSGVVEENKTILPEWMIYGGIGGIAAIVGGVIYFLKKPKKQLEDEDELYE
jgi:hypothetical protein